MTLDPVTVAARWAQQLPLEFARGLAVAQRAGRSGLHVSRAKVALPELSAAVRTGLALAEQGDAAVHRCVLTGWLAAATAQQQVTPVWTGPESDAGHGRLTLAVVADLMAEAEQQLVLASYATVPGDGIRQALRDAVDRGITVMLATRGAGPGPGDPWLSIPPASS